jgi:predicted nucleotidyltransferase
MRSDRFGLSQPQWELLTRLLLQPIKEAGGQVWIFGSRARGDYQQFSDLDVLVGGPVTPALISSIGEQLEESTLPIRVDLVLEPNLADAYRSGVLNERVEIS